MYRKEISNGDLLLTFKPWYALGKYTPYRNLSEEVRKLHKLQEKAKAKYMELQHSYTVASTNIGDDLETLQIHLLDNSKAYFEIEVNNSILEEREGTRYKFNHSNNKQGANQNKDAQKKNQQEQQKKKQDASGSGGNVMSVAQFMGAKVVVPKQ
jgi:hypothetical protein